MSSLTDPATAAKRPTPPASDEYTPYSHMPQKKWYRSRAHCNPLSFNDNFSYPSQPHTYDWIKEGHYYFNGSGDDIQGGGDDDITDKCKIHSLNPCKNPPYPTIIDVGCGFGGLTTALCKEYPNESILGVEIRQKVCEYVRLRIVAGVNGNGGEEDEFDNEEDDVVKPGEADADDDKNLSTVREPNPNDGSADKYGWNATCLRANFMKTLPNYIRPGTIKELFICFPDPHFKKHNHRRRILNEDLLCDYSYVIKPKGRIYVITDVRELHLWHVEHLTNHSKFVCLGSYDDEETNENHIGKTDKSVELMIVSTEEGKKVGRAKARKYWTVFERVDDTDGNAEKVENGGITEENFWEVPEEKKEWGRVHAVKGEHGTR